jgi:uridine kinase
VIEELLARPPRNGVYPTVCVDGRGGSGKSTFAELLVAAVPGLALVHGDDYFEPVDDELSWGEFNEMRFDADVLSRLRTGDRRIPVRPYDFPAGRTGPERMVTVERGLVVDRWFSFALDVAWDVRIWVETPAEVCLERGLARDGAVALGERARLTWETVWQPREDRYIGETSPLETADLVIDGTRPFL